MTGRAATPSPLPRLDTRPLFEPLLAELLALLGGLATDDWRRLATRRWTVQDVAAHLLDGDCRQLAFGRDAMPLPPPERPIRGPEDLLDFLDGLNADWVKAMKRTSPALLIDLLALTGRRVVAHFAALDLDAEAVFGVAWAGEERSRNWMHLARELSERFHHQQQIRRATGRPPLADPALVGAALEVLLYGLRPAYSRVTAPEGTAVAVGFTSPVSRHYALVRRDGRWSLEGEHPDPDATIELDPDTAWLALTRSIPRHEAARRARVNGDPALTSAFFDACSIHKRPVEE